MGSYGQESGYLVPADRSYAQRTFVVDETGRASHVILHQGGRDRGGGERMATRVN